MTVSPAYSQTLLSANGQVTLDANGQQSFIDRLGFSTCSGGGENVVATAYVQVTNTTMTTTSRFTNVPLAAVVASLTIAPVSVLVYELISRFASLYRPLDTEKETISTDNHLSSNPYPLQHQEPLRPPHRPRSSPLLVVSNITFNNSPSILNLNSPTVFPSHRTLEILSKRSNQHCIQNQTLTPFHFQSPTSSSETPPSRQRPTPSASPSSTGASPATPSRPRPVESPSTPAPQQTSPRAPPSSRERHRRSAGSMPGWRSG